MFKFKIGFRDGGVQLPDLGLWLDAHEPVLGPERVFVSHAHSDHVAQHREVILSAATSRLMRARVPGERLEHVLEFRERRMFGEVAITLYPAGHIFGSAMALIEAEGERLLYTGDFKLRPGRSSEPCEPCAADILIMETTFGRPRYVFPPTAGVLEGVIRFCREALDNDETPVLLGYSLGKSQEILCGLGEAGLPLMLHGTVHRLTQIYEQFGQCFPRYERYEAGTVRGKVLICPPNVVNSAMLRNVGRVRTAILTGWAVEPNCRYRYRCDAAFPLSDHADFPDLVEFVRRVGPKQVYTLHGFAAEFASTLRELGYEAYALSQDEQLGLRLEGGGSAECGAKSKECPQTEPEAAARQGEQPVEAGGQGTGSALSFRAFAETCAAIGRDARKLEKTRVLAEFLRPLQGEVVGIVATWFSGRVFPANQNKVLNLGWAVVRDALCAATGVEENGFHQIYLKHSDLGETAAELVQVKSRRGGELTVAEVHAVFERLLAARGPLAKRPILRQALERCSALEAKYLVKIITGDLRIGLKEGLVEEAVALAFGREADAVRQANLLAGDVGEAARLASEDRLAEATVRPFRPVKFMLASPEETAAGIWERMGAAGPDGGTVWLEDKYDGIRCQLHKVGRQVALYSRDLKDVTSTFLELADSVARMEGDFILDGEVLAMRGETVLPFADLQRRLGRKQGDLFMREEVPIQFVGFDLLWMAGRSCLDRPLRERRAGLEQLVRGGDCLRLARITSVGSVEEIESAFTAARERGNEGLMIKDPASAYTPGRRGLSWLKLKKAYATLDCVVVGAEYGHGKRNQVLSDYTFAVRDESTGELRVIGKAYSGLTDAEIAELTGHFLRRALRQHGRYFEVPPEVVLEIAFDRIQPSNRHDSGLALRFPRIVRIRTDKTPLEIDTLETARKLAEANRTPA